MMLSAVTFTRLLALLLHDFASIEPSSFGHQRVDAAPPPPPPTAATAVSGDCCPPSCPASARLLPLRSACAACACCSASSRSCSSLPTSSAIAQDAASHDRARPLGSAPRASRSLSTSAARPARPSSLATASMSEPARVSCRASRTELGRGDSEKELPCRRDARRSLNRQRQPRQTCFGQRRRTGFEPVVPREAPPEGSGVLRLEVHNAGSPLPLSPLLPCTPGRLLARVRRRRRGCAAAAHGDAPRRPLDQRVEASEIPGRKRGKKEDNDEIKRGLCREGGKAGDMRRRCARR